MRTFHDRKKFFYKFFFGDFLARLPRLGFHLHASRAQVQTPPPVQWWVEGRYDEHMVVKINSVILGEGNPVLFLHGTPVDHRFMLPLDPAFEDHDNIQRVYIDMPGYGKTAANGEIHSSLDVANAVTQFAKDTFQGKPFAVVGNSFGGMIARHLAAEFHDSLAGLALLCPAVVPNTKDRDLPPKVAVTKDDEFLKTLKPGDKAEFAAVEIHLTQPQWELFHAHALPGIAAHDKATVKEIRAHYPLPEEPESRFDTFDQPTLIITGRQDFIVGYRDQFKLLDHYPHATYLVIDDAGHNAHLDQPELVYAAFYDWVGKLRW